MLGAVSETPTSKDEAASTRVPDEVELISSERLVVFSDAVIAIALTLLALELPLPSGASNHDLLASAVNENLDAYLAFLISFVVIAVNWRGHHWVFRYVNSTQPILGLNLLWLFFIVVTPFATRLLTPDGAFQVRFI